MAKKIHVNSIVGQQGVTLVQQIVLDMGFLFYPAGGVEAGIDGTIEIRDSSSGEVTNCILAVQSKAVSERFEAETETSFTFLCSERDLDYWMGGNVPVLLILSRPSTREAYWVVVGDYFRDPLIRKSRKVVFDKRDHALTVASKSQLIQIAMPQRAGLYLTPTPRAEQLYTNLLPITRHTERLFVAETPYADATELTARFRLVGARFGHEWFLKGDRLFTLHDLREYPWSEVCDRGSVECFALSDYAQSDDPDDQRDFVRLLNRCLTAKLRPDVSWDREHKYHRFNATDDLRTMKRSYQGLQKATSREVFEVYRSKKEQDRIVYCRHMALKSFFQRYDRTWYLELSPTYHYTTNGHDPYPFYENELSGIKRMERNNAVLGQVVFWARYLSHVDLFSEYPFLDFGWLEPFEIAVGVDDAAWLKHEEPEEAQLASSVDDNLTLDLWGLK